MQKHVVRGREFVAPGPGAWEVEGAHFPRPLTRLAQRAILGNFEAGFSASTAKYGLGLDHLKPAYVHSCTYMQAVPFGAPPGAVKPPPKLVFQLLTRLHPGLRRRLRLSEKAMAERKWRSELVRWDTEVKPAAERAHQALQAIDVAALDDDGLGRHLQACFDQVGRMVVQHHDFTIDCALPIGDLLAHVHAWTGLAPAEVLQCLRGSTRISLGFAADELARLTDALRTTPEAARALSDERPPRSALDALLATPGAVGEAAKAYVERVGNRVIGYDIADLRAIEMPEMLVKAVRAALEGAKPRADDGNERVARLRERVPEAHRATLDALLAEARFVNRLRDERGFYSESWALGLLRRAVLEVGRRAEAGGRLDSAVLAIDADLDELLALLSGSGGPSSEALRERATWRKTFSLTDAPPWLGAPPPKPPPAEWLPAHARRAARATDAFLSALFDEAPPVADPVSVRGLPVSPGTYEGVARIVVDERDFGRLQPGDVLVTRATSPTFNVVLPLLGALVTDRGGQLCHAAIVAREYGLPGVVGTREATRRIADGARVRVDGQTGEVLVLP